MKSKPYYPEGWRESFGLPVAEHERALDINILDGYARIQIIEQRNVKKTKTPLPSVDAAPVAEEDTPVVQEEADTVPVEDEPDPTPMEDAFPYLFGRR